MMITYTWNLSYDTNELIYKTEKDSQAQKTACGCQGKGIVGEGWIGSLGLADETIIQRVDKQ